MPLQSYAAGATACGAALKGRSAAFAEFIAASAPSATPAEINLFMTQPLSNTPTVWAGPTIGHSAPFVCDLPATLSVIPRRAKSAVRAEMAQEIKCTYISAPNRGRVAASGGEMHVQIGAARVSKQPVAAGGKLQRCLT